MSVELKDLEIFADLDPAQRGDLAKTLKERTLAGGEQLFAQGDAADSCFLILDGSVEVKLEVDGHGTEQLSSLSKGDLFGEVALLDGQARSATCAAGADGARVAELARADFDRLFNAGDQLAQAVMDVVLDRLVGRLRGATQLLLQVTAE